MKNLFVAILFSIFFFTNCSESPQIISDICTITDEICYYADLVCKNFHQNESLQKSQSSQISDLKNISDELKSEFISLQKFKSSGKEISENELKLRMLKIRNELKEIFEDQLKLIKENCK